MENQHRILVVGNSRHHSVNLLNLAEKLTLLDSTVEVVLVCDPMDINFYNGLAKLASTKIIQFSFRFNSPTTNEDVKINSIDYASLAKSHGIVNYLYDGVKNIVTRFPVFTTLINFAKNSSLGCLFLEKKNVLFYTNLKNKALKLFDEFSPTVVFAFGDRHIDLEAPILMAAKERGVKVIIPYVTFSDKSGLLTIRKVIHGLHIFSNISLYRLYSIFRLKSQVYENYFYQTPSVLHALNKLGGISKNPWCIGNGMSDVVCVDSFYTLKRYVSEGVSEDKIKIAGDLAYDTLFDHINDKDKLRREFFEQHRLGQDKPIIVLALPQFAEQGVMDWEQHWKEVNYLTESLSSLNCTLLISLHPRVNPLDYEYLRGQMNILISSKPLNQILPIADLFIAVNSSTVIWAVLCGIQTVVLDFYGLDSLIFRHLNSIKYITNRSNLGIQVNEILGNVNSVNFKSDWETLSKDEIFDGQVVNRYYKIINE